MALLCSELARVGAGRVVHARIPECASLASEEVNLVHALAEASVLGLRRERGPTCAL